MQRLMALFLLLLANSSYAQAQSSGATDNELYAAYCKGVVDGIGQATAEGQAISRRFLGYLYATGVMTDPQRRNAIMGLGAATKRGSTDQQQCNVTMDACSEAILGGANVPLPNNKRGSQVQACMIRDSHCQRSSRCFAPDALPF